MSAAGSEAVLDVRDLGVSFGPGRDAVSDVSLQIARGELVALVGESGCGKSATALALMGLLPDTATSTGSATVDGHQLVGASERELRRLRGASISMVFQDASTALNPLMRIGAQIAESLAIHTSMSRRERLARAVSLLEQVGVPDAATRARQLPHELSGGTRQRAMIALALAGSPDVVIADEPTTALDVTVQAQVLDVLRETTRDAAVLFITHDMGVVAQTADTVVVMYAGSVVESGTVVDVLDDPQHPYTAMLLASIPDPDVPETGDLPTIPGRVPPLGSRPDGCRFRDRCPRATERCLERPELAPSPHRAAVQVACWHPGRAAS
ncbi:ABC transporter ATP-binding protein [Solicola sp. PLA-1-18]|uniref:ABC transporter ATP-binding protein n=1 Tax=Solicola sp. PLA-1-18 TaxID=3380532 RepID=UPI003B767301